MAPSMTGRYDEYHSTYIHTYERTSGDKKGIDVVTLTHSLLGMLIISVYSMFLSLIHTYIHTYIHLLIWMHEFCSHAVAG